MLVAVTGALQLAGGRITHALRYERVSVASGEWWRLWSGHLVHLSFAHWLMNMAGLAGLWWLYAPLLARREWLIVALASAGAISIALYAASPAVGWYVGLSGVLHALWAAAALAMWRHSRLESVASLTLLAGKLALEYVVGPLSAGGEGALPVVTVAHRYGALAGAGVALALRVWRKPL